METRYKVEQVKAYRNAMQNPKNPLRDTIERRKGVHTGKRQVMDGPSRIINRACVRSSRSQASKGLGKHSAELKPYCKTLLAENPGTHCCEWPMQKYKCLFKPVAGHKTSQSTLMAQSQGTSLVGGFTLKQCRRPVHEDSRAHRVTTSGLTMEIEAVAHAIQWLASQRDSQITHTIILIDSMNLLLKDGVWNGMPRQTHSYAESSATKTSVDLLPRACWSQWQAQQISHLVCSLAGQRCFEALGIF